MKSKEVAREKSFDENREESFEQEESFDDNVFSGLSSTSEDI